MNSRFLTEGKTPEQIASDLHARGIDASPRMVREKARRLGAYGILGKAMVLLPEHIDRIFQEEQARCPKSTSAGTVPTGTSTPLAPMADAVERARKRLTRASPKTLR